jgi:hypothetical protein
MLQLASHLLSVDEEEHALSLFVETTGICFLLLFLLFLKRKCTKS